VRLRARLGVDERIIDVTTDPTVHLLKLQNVVPLLHQALGYLTAVYIKQISKAADPFRDSLCDRAS
jgi:hypothetical protein